MIHLWHKKRLNVECNTENNYLFVCSKTHVLGVLKPNTTVWLRSTNKFPKGVEKELQAFVEDNISYGSIDQLELAVLYKMFGSKEELIA